MRLSAFSIVDDFPEDPLPPGRDRYREVVDLAAAAEAGGLSTLWIAEHHFGSGGRCPSPPILLSACGERTRHLRLGTMVSVLPFHEPVRLAEDLALVDHLTDGRLSVGFGSGYLAREFAGFGVDPAEKRRRFDTALTTILAAWHGEEVRIAAPGSQQIRIDPRPLQQPHPPIWIAAQRREAVRALARAGWSVALVPYATADGMDDLRAVIAEYRALRPAGSSGEIAIALHVYAGDDPGRARLAFARFLDSRRSTGSTFYLEKIGRDPARAGPEALEREGFAAFGSPHEVIAALRRFERIGVDEILGIFDFGALPAGEVLASVRALGSAYRPSTAERGR